MNDIKPIFFLVPGIVLILVCVIYFYLLKKTTDRKVFNKFIFTIVILALILNFAWELIKIPLYKNAIYDTNHIAFCALASLADVLMVLLLYLSLAVIFKYFLDTAFKITPHSYCSFHWCGRSCFI